LRAGDPPARRPATGTAPSRTRGSFADALPLRKGAAPTPASWTVP